MLLLLDIGTPPNSTLIKKQRQTRCMTAYVINAFFCTPYEMIQGREEGGGGQEIINILRYV